MRHRNHSAMSTEIATSTMDGAGDGAGHTPESNLKMLMESAQNAQSAGVDNSSMGAATGQPDLAGPAIPGGLEMLQESAARATAAPKPALPHTASAFPTPGF